jgi:hypothetical protein
MRRRGAARGLLPQPDAVRPAEPDDMHPEYAGCQHGSHRGYSPICTHSRGSRHRQCERPWSPASGCPQAVSLLQPGRALPAGSGRRPVRCGGFPDGLWSGRAAGVQTVLRAGLRFAFYRRVSTEDWQDPESSRARQLRQALMLTAGHGTIMALPAGHARGYLARRW